MVVRDLIEKIRGSHKARQAAPKIYDFIHEQEHHPANKGHDGVVVVGLNSGGKEIAEIIEDMYEENDNVPYFSLLSVKAEQYAEWALDWDIDKANVDYNLDDKLVILIDSAIKTGESAYLALRELCRVNRPKYVRLAVVGDNSKARTWPIQPDKVIR